MQYIKLYQENIISQCAWNLAHNCDLTIIIFLFVASSIWRWADERNRNGRKILEYIYRIWICTFGTKSAYWILFQYRNIENTYFDIFPLPFLAMFILLCIWFEKIVFTDVNKESWDGPRNLPQRDYSYHMVSLEESSHFKSETPLL